MSQAVTALTAEPQEDPRHRDLRRTGQPLDPDWRQQFLAHYAHYGTYWKACKAAGVSPRTVERYKHAEPDFGQQIEDARQEFADSQEVSLMAIGQAGNPVGPIVLLKKHRPNEYIEKTVSLSLTATTELPPEDGRQLLHAMFGPPGGQALPPAQETP